MLAVGFPVSTVSKKTLCLRHPKQAPNLSTSHRIAHGQNVPPEVAPLFAVHPEARIHAKNQESQALSSLQVQPNVPECIYKLVYAASVGCGMFWTHCSKRLKKLAMAASLAWPCKLAPCIHLRKALVHRLPPMQQQKTANSIASDCQKKTRKQQAPRKFQPRRTTVSGGPQGLLVVSCLAKPNSITKRLHQLLYITN